jgi:DNA-binding transcriptional LysR family regulator
VLDLGAINDVQREAWCQTIDAFDEGSRRHRQLALLPADREVPACADGYGVQVRLDAMELRRPRQGRGWAAGSVRLTAIPMLLNRILVPALPELLKANPLLQLHLVADPRNLSLMNREPDIAVRLARPDKENRTIARRIGEFAYTVYGPAGAPSRALSWITYDNLSALPHVKWIEEAIKQEPEAGMRLAVNDSDVAVHAIRAGLGRSLLPCCIADREPGLSRLSRQSLFCPANCGSLFIRSLDIWHG